MIIGSGGLPGHTRVQWCEWRGGRGSGAAVRVGIPEAHRDGTVRCLCQGRSHSHTRTASPEQTSMCALVIQQCLELEILLIFCRVFLFFIFYLNWCFEYNLQSRTNEYLKLMVIMGSDCDLLLDKCQGK